MFFLIKLPTESCQKTLTFATSAPIRSGVYIIVARGTSCHPVLACRVLSVAATVFNVGVCLALPCLACSIGFASIPNKFNAAFFLVLLSCVLWNVGVFIVLAPRMFPNFW